MKKLGVQVNSDDSPQARFLSQGAVALSDRELLSLVVTGSNGMSALAVADNLLAVADGTLDGMRKLSAPRMATVAGVSQSVAVRVAASCAIAQRMGEYSDVPQKINGSNDIQAIFRPILENLPYEEVWMVNLSPGKRILSRNMLSRGTASNSLIDVRLVVRQALDNMAAGVVMVHNHPSGSCAPSNYDISITHQVRAALEIFDVKLVDHLILGPNDYFSFAEQAIL